MLHVELWAHKTDENTAQLVIKMQILHVTPQMRWKNVKSNEKSVEFFLSTLPIWQTCVCDG